MLEGISNFVKGRDSKYGLTSTNKPTLLSEISSLNGLWNPSVMNCSARNDLSIFVSAIKRIYEITYNSFGVLERFI